ncbi:hypothetical protein LX32DRAFT_349202 [Colletotrichum zoysiae]|uniref:Uncharacterized protein n=1 Tax=Colletotrichum zoysiae TaxID=1216348 RepID=A0AAD9HIW0_9PEZI|nr:hypothetical protein LX32DRAFT_349202 [Colletotrichum zoysiae]
MRRTREPDRPRGWFVLGTLQADQQLGVAAQGGRGVSNWANRGRRRPGVCLSSPASGLWGLDLAGPGSCCDGSRREGESDVAGGMQVAEFGSISKLGDTERTAITSRNAMLPQQMLVCSFVSLASSTAGQSTSSRSRRLVTGRKSNVNRVGGGSAQRDLGDAREGAHGARGKAAAVADDSMGKVS